MPKGVAGSVAEHGTPARYNTHRCRCADCTRAWRDYQRLIYGKQPLEERLAEIEPDHGTEARYSSRKWRCRCAECREASRVARARRRAAA